MGGGPIVRLEPVTKDDQVTYLVTAEHGLAFSGEYDSYGEAMGALAIFGSLVWHLWHLSHTPAIRGLVWRPKPLPWPPGPR